MSKKNLIEQEGEIDLEVVFKKIRNFFLRIVLTIFRFVKKLIFKWKVILSLIIIGYAAGFLLLKLSDSGQDKEAKILIKINFDSVNYVYDAIAAIEQNIFSSNKEFFKNDMFLDANEVIYSIKISPVIDLKKIINEENLRAGEIRALFDKLVFDDGDLMTDSFKSDYEYHSLEISLSGGSKFTTIEKIVDYINANPLFVDLKEQGLNSISRTIYANELTIKQIDRILENYSISPEKNDNTSQLYIDNKQVQPNELIKTKILLQQQNEDLKQQKLLSEKTVMIITPNTSIVNANSFFQNKPSAYAALFVATYVLILILGSFYQFLERLDKEMHQ